MIKCQVAYHWLPPNCQDARDYYLHIGLVLVAVVEVVLLPLDSTLVLALGGINGRRGTCMNSSCETGCTVVVSHLAKKKKNSRLILAADPIPLNSLRVFLSLFKRRLKSGLFDPFSITSSQVPTDLIRGDVAEQGGRDTPQALALHLPLVNHLDCLGRHHHL